jgi:hypothetical protein
MPRRSTLPTGSFLRFVRLDSRGCMSVPAASRRTTRHGPDTAIRVKEGIHKPWYATYPRNWIPASAGMTIQALREPLLHASKCGHTPDDRSRIAWARRIEYNRDRQMVGAGRGDLTKVRVPDAPVAGEGSGGVVDEVVARHSRGMDASPVLAGLVPCDGRRSGSDPARDGAGLSVSVGDLRPGFLYARSGRERPAASPVA